MSSIRHIIPTSLPSSPVNARPLLLSADQPPTSIDRPHTLPASKKAEPTRITIGHDRTSVTVRVGGAVTAAGTAQLATMLSAMSQAGGGRVIVQLIDVGSVCAELLQVLRTARTMLQGRLSVTANRQEARFALALVGLGDTTWPETCESDAEADQTADAQRYLKSARDWDC